MPDIDSINLKEHITSAAIEVFRTMLSMEVEPAVSTGTAALERNRIVGAVGFAGEIIGNVSIQTDNEFSRIITEAILGRTAGSLVSREEINDVIGELSSMIGGNLKSRICDAGLMCELSFPSVTTGDDFKIEHMSWERHERFIFRYHEHETFVDVRIKMVNKRPEEENDMHDEGTGSVDIEKFINNAAIEVFDMMLSMEIEPCEVNDTALVDGGRIVGAVSFAGDVTGNVSVQVTQSFGEVITANMLGIDIEEIEDDEEVNDAVGELSNMIGGNLKSRFCDSGFPCELSIPSVTTGSDFKIENLGWTRHEQYAFKHQQYTALVEVCMKLEKIS